MTGSEMFQEINAQLGAINLLELCLYFILFFIGGYLMYASLFAAIGAMVNSQEDTQQFMMPITILILFAFYAGFYSSQNPDGPLAFWTSLIPLTSPIVMMTRLPYEVPWWELTLSIVLLVATVVLIIQLAAKIYRVGILMYGKKPTYGEIVKWLKY
jgi:ABC-2 type transport system permease protein